MDKKKIIWSDRAEKEFLNILEFYCNRNKSNTYSENLIDKVELICSSISEFELIGVETSLKGVRNIIFDNFSIFYEIQKERIEILSFWDNRQNPTKRIDN